MKRLIVLLFGIVTVTPAFAGKKIVAGSSDAATIKADLSAKKVPQPLIDKVVAWRTDTAKFAADQELACPKNVPFSPQCPVADGYNGVWWAFQNAGWDNIPQGVLAQLGNERGEKAYLWHKLDPAKLEEQVAKETNTFVTTTWIEKFYDLISKHPDYKTIVPGGTGPWPRWAAMEEGYKNADAMKVIMDFNNAWRKLLVPFKNNVGMWEKEFKPGGKLPECDAIEAEILKIVPVDKEWTRKELVIAANKPEFFELMRLESWCALYEGHYMKATAVDRAREMFSYAARDKSISPDGSHDFVRDFGAPFGKPLFTLGAVSTYSVGHSCDWKGSSQYEDNDLGLVAGGDVASIKDTPDGTLITYKKANWTVDDIQCGQDTGLQWSTTGQLEHSRTCKKIGTKKISYQEDPHLFPKGMKVPGLKVGMFVTSSSALCPGEKHGEPRQAFPIEVYPDHNLKNGTQRSYLWWTMKPAVADAPAAKGKTKK